MLTREVISHRKRFRSVLIATAVSLTVALGGAAIVGPRLMLDMRADAMHRVHVHHHHYRCAARIK